MVSLPRGQVQSLVRELRAHKLHGVTKNKKRNRWTNRSGKDPEKAKDRIRRKWCFLNQRTRVSKKSNHVNKNTKGSKKKLGLKGKKVSNGFIC